MARRELLRVRLSRRELEALDRLAVVRGSSTRSELIRELVREADPAPRPPATLDELLAPFAGPPLS
jgi:hypothetical protein